MKLRSSSFNLSDAGLLVKSVLLVMYKFGQKSGTILNFQLLREFRVRYVGLLSTKSGLYKKSLV